MDFLPLAIWAVGFLYIVEKVDTTDIESIGSFYFIGCFVFLILGLISLF